MPGAVDLSGLRRPPASPPGAAPAAAGSPGAAPGPAAAAGGPPAAPAPSSGVVIDVTEASFEAEVINRSMHVPVVLDFWAEWCGPCKSLSPILEKLAIEYAGKWVLAKIDVDAEQRLGQAFQIQSIPSVMAVIGGQPVPLFQGAVPEAEVRQVLEELLKVAAANGVTGTVSVEASDEAAIPVGPPADPAYDEAHAALDRGDVDAALAAFSSILDRSPADAEAISSVARCELLIRTRGADEQAIRTRAADQPQDVAAQLAVADLDMLRGSVEDAISRIVDVVRLTAGDERDAARQRLLALFNVLDPQDPRLAAGRRALANALF
jgi:putative thioredoxin